MYWENAGTIEFREMHGVRAKKIRPNEIQLQLHVIHGKQFAASS